MYEHRSEMLLWAFSAGTGGSSKRKQTKSPTDKNTPAATKALRSNFQEHNLMLQKLKKLLKIYERNMAINTQVSSTMSGHT